ncbi:hypothetical protein DU40_13590 [Methanosarcina mazei]|uniref:SF3 helicase domain-containing protein n=1 Tax=Methanosarcina mazei TaxID=2209 RepID=A0A0F8CLU0_METMZ|nr:DNA primase family protein [Methanosarcina mazei]KKG05874.1 hypothetical protein DU40_13590 [Methanosarcina mazei]
MTEIKSENLEVKNSSETVTSEAEVTPELTSTDVEIESSEVSERATAEAIKAETTKEVAPTVSSPDDKKYVIVYEKGMNEIEKRKKLDKFLAPHFTNAIREALHRDDIEVTEEITYNPQTIRDYFSSKGLEEKSIVSLISNIEDKRTKLSNYLLEWEDPLHARLKTDEDRKLEESETEDVDYKKIFAEKDRYRIYLLTLSKEGVQEEKESLLSLIKEKKFATLYDECLTHEKVSVCTAVLTGNKTGKESFLYKDLLFKEEIKLGSQKMLGKVSQAVAEQYILTHNIVVLKPDNKIFTFDEEERVHTEISEEVAKTELKKLCNALPDTYTTDRVETECFKQLINNTMSVTFREKIELDVNHVPLLNGILNLRTNELKPYTKKDVYPERIQGNYDPEAKPTPYLTKWIESTFRGVEYETDLFWEWMGYQLYKEYPFQVFFYFLGPGGDGKSVAIELMQRWLNAVSLVPFTEICSPSKDTITGACIDKYANISSETKERLIIYDSSGLKSITGGDRQPTRELYGKVKNVDLYCKITHACNHLPRIVDESKGMIHRKKMIVFPNQFRNTDQEIKMLADKIVKEGGLDYFTLKAIEGLHRLFKNDKFSENKDAIKRIKILEDPVEYFINTYMDFTGESNKRVIFDECVKAIETFTYHMGSGKFGAKHIKNIIKDRYKDCEIKAQRVTDATQKPYYTTNKKERPVTISRCFIDYIALWNDIGSEKLKDEDAVIEEAKEEKTEFAEVDEELVEEYLRDREDRSTFRELPNVDGFTDLGIKREEKELLAKTGSLKKDLSEIAAMCVKEFK